MSVALSVPGASSPVSSPVRRVLEALQGVEAKHGYWMARCPAHDDRAASLSVKEGRDGRALLNCHAGCETRDIVARLGLALSDLFAEDRASPYRPSSSGRAHASADPDPATRTAFVASYDYTDADGQLVFQTCRFRITKKDGQPGKTFRQRRPNPARPGDWIYSLGDTEPVLYRLPDVLAAVESGRRVFVCEGEKDVESLRELGFIATTNAMGAGKWRESYSEALRGAEVVILPDNDDAGRSHAEQVAASLAAVDCVVRVVALPDLPPKGDVSDWLERGGDLDTLERLIGETPRWRPDPEGEAHRTRWRLDELWENDAIMRPPPAIVPRLAWAGRSTLFAAGEKTGKSTMTGYIAAQVSTGGMFLGDLCQQGPVLIVGLEEFIGDAARRLRHFGADATCVHLVDRLPGDPRERLQAVHAHVDAVKPVLVILDSLMAYSAGGISDASSSAQMHAVTDELTRLAHERAVALVIIHHARKSDGRYRDSSAIGGAVDLIVEMFTPDPDADPTRRKLRAIGRVPVPPFTECWFDGQHYRLEQGAAAPLEDRVLDYVRSHPSCSVRDVCDAMGSRWADTQRTIDTLLTSRLLSNMGTESRKKLIVPGPDFLTGGRRAE